VGDPQRGALVINVTLLHDWEPRALVLAPVMKQKIGKEILIFESGSVACSTKRSVASRNNAVASYRTSSQTNGGMSTFVYIQH
jgi:hypothetical protein